MLDDVIVGHSSSNHDDEDGRCGMLDAGARINELRLLLFLVVGYSGRGHDDDAGRRGVEDGRISASKLDF